MMYVTKTMPRPLSEEEKEELREYIKNNPNASGIGTIQLFEEKFKTPITETCFLKLIIEVAVSEVGRFES